MCPPRHWGSSSSGSSEESHRFSPCFSHFQTRYAIATHEPSKEVMEHFPSKHGNYRYVGPFTFCYVIFCGTRSNAGLICGKLP